MQKCISGNQESSAASRMMGKNDAKIWKNMVFGTKMVTFIFMSALFIFLNFFGS